MIYRVRADLLVEAEDADLAYGVASNHFARLARHDWSDLVLPGSEATADCAEELKNEDAG